MKNNKLYRNIDVLSKKCFDILLSGFGIIVSSPLWVFIAIAIIIEDGFPVFIRQDRIGKMGRLFKSFKFRSMKKYALKERINIQSSEHDPRITRVGAILRKCAMDELPQLINILLGDMSFVGPRALLPVESEVHGHTNGGTLEISAIPGFSQRITVTPGLTGIAQIWASRDILRQHKFKYDLLYLRKRSFWLDLKLIFISFLVTFRSSWEKRGTKLSLLEQGNKGARTLRSQGAEEKRRIWDYILDWSPLAVFLILIFPLFNLYDKTLYIWDHFRIFGDTIRVFIPETPLYVLTTLWAVVRDLSHVGAYALVTYLLFRGFTHKGKNIRLNHFVYTGSLLFAFCMIDEIIQSIMPTRGFQATDIILNLLAATGVLLIMHRKFSRAEEKRRTGEKELRSQGAGEKRRRWVLTPRIAGILHAWLPPVLYVGLFAVLANFVLTNNNTVYVIDRFFETFRPDVSYGSLCMWVGKSRDYSHILIYAIFTMLVFRAVRSTCNRSILCCAIMSGLIALSFGVLDELAQGLVMGRSSSVHDWFIDIVGVTVGCLVIFVRRRETLQRRQAVNGRRQAVNGRR